MVEKMRLDESLSVPLYEQLAGIIREMVKGGRLKPGEPIPPESELVVLYGVSRTTVRQALAVLAQEGLIYRKQGKGSFVCPPKIVQPLGVLRSFSEEITLLGFEPGASLVKQDWCPADQTVAQNLDLVPGEQVLEVVRLRFADQKELCVTRSYLSRKYGDLLRDEDFGGPSLYQIFERRIGRLVKATEVIGATAATPEDARLLKVRAGAPLMRLERTTYLATGEPVEFIRANFRPDRYTFFIELKR